MAGKYFGTDGIRGRANGTITPELALKVGQAAALIFRRGEYRHRVLIGKDTRLSGYMIETALIAGFTSVGMDVFQTGPMPTPAVAMLTRSMRADLGVMISASHNPYDDNGIKLFGPDGFKLSDEVEHKIEELVDTNLVKMLAKGGDLGRARRIDDGQGRYVEFAKRTLPRNLSLDGLRVVVDCANGAAYKVAPQALWELGAEVISMGVEPDGFNINRECGSTETAPLCRKVKEMRADIGIALDGDRYVLEHMRAHGFNVGGESSGHIILSDYTTTGDGLLTALQVLAVVKKQEQPVSNVCHRFDPLPQVLKNVRYKSGKPLENAKVRNAIKDAQARLDGHGRLIVRSSGTEPVIRVMGEGDDKVLIEEVVDGIVDALNSAA